MVRFSGHLRVSLSLPSSPVAEQAGPALVVGLSTGRHHGGAVLGGSRLARLCPVRRSLRGTVRHSKANVPRLIGQWLER